MSTMRTLACLWATLIMGPLALAQEALPTRKPGLWQLTMNAQGTPGAKPMDSQQCIDARTDEQMQRRAMQGDPGQCTHGPARRLAGAWEMDSVCKTPEGQARSHIRISGDPQSRYEVDLHTRYEPPRKGQGEMRMKILAEWKGACPAGMKPGDMKTAGMVFNPQAMGDPAKMRQMKPEELKKMMEQMKAAQGR